MDEDVSSNDDRDQTNSSMITKPELKIGDEFLKILRDNSFNDAKEMWDAIKFRFGGNDESKKMQKTKPGVDSLSFDDLYNNLRVFENDVKGSTASSSSSQNVAFVFENTSSTNDGSSKHNVSVSDDNSSEHSSCQSNDSEGSCGNTSEHSFETESESLSVPNEMSKSRLEITNEKVVSELQEVEPSCAKHVKTPRQPLKDKETHKVNRKNWNDMIERELGEDCDYYEKKMAREAEDKRVFNTGYWMEKPVWTKANRGAVVSTKADPSLQRPGSLRELNFSGSVRNIPIEETSDNGTEFKNRDMLEFCGNKGIKQEYSNARTPQQNGVAERMNRTLIEAARTMLADSLLPTTFWAEAVSTACYIFNRVRVTKPQNKTPYELLFGHKPIISYIRPFGCHVTILDTLSVLGKFDGKSDEGFLIKTQCQRKSRNIDGTSEKTNNAGTSQTPKSNASEEKDEDVELIVVPSAVTIPEEIVDSQESYTKSKDKEEDLDRPSAREGFLNDTLESLLKTNSTSTPSVNTGSQTVNTGRLDHDDSPMPELEIFHKSETGIFDEASYDEEGVITDFNSLPIEIEEEPKKIAEALQDDSWVQAMQEELLQFKLQTCMVVKAFVWTASSFLRLQKSWCDEFEALMKSRISDEFRVELTIFLRTTSQTEQRERRESSYLRLNMCLLCFQVNSKDFSSQCCQENLHVIKGKPRLGCYGILGNHPFDFRIAFSVLSLILWWGPTLKGQEHHTVTQTQPSSSTLPVPSTSSPLVQSPPPIPASIPTPTPIPETEPAPFKHTFEEPSPVHQHFSPPQEQAHGQMTMDDFTSCRFLS
ncbi:putative ribonuclease H-like domain-containing protein [Tanacetum coccineum]